MHVGELNLARQRDIIEESSSLPIDNNRYIIKPNNKKVAEPSSTSFAKNYRKKIDTLTYDNFDLSKKTKTWQQKIKNWRWIYHLKIIRKNTEVEILNEELCNVKNLLKRKEDDLSILKERMKKVIKI